MPTVDDKKTERTGRWKDKVYTKQITEYVDQSLRTDEKNVYQTIFDSLAEKYDLKEPNELMLLDLAVYDYIRVKRLHLLLKDESDIVNIKTRTGQVVRKAHEAGYLINAIETQFRQSMKELLLTPKSRIQKTIGQEPKDFTEALGIVMDGEFTEEDKDGERDKSRDDETEKEKTEFGDTTGESKRTDRKDENTKKDIDARTS